MFPNSSPVMRLSWPVVLYFPAHSSRALSHDQHGHNVPSTSTNRPLVICFASSGSGLNSSVACAISGVTRVSELCGEGVAGPGVVGDLRGLGLAWPYGRKSGGEELAAEPGEHVGGAGLGLGGVPRA